MRTAKKSPAKQRPAKGNPSTQLPARESRPNQSAGNEDHGPYQVNSTENGLRYLMRDDAMAPRVRHGDIIEVKSKCEPRTLDFALVKVKGAGWFFRRVAMEDGQFFLCTNNPPERSRPFNAADIEAFHPAYELSRVLGPESWGPELQEPVSAGGSESNPSAPASSYENVRRLKDSMDEMHSAITRAVGLLYLFAETHAQYCIDNKAPLIPMAQAESMAFLADDVAEMLTGQRENVWAGIMALQAASKPSPALGNRQEN